MNSGASRVILTTFSKHPLTRPRPHAVRCKVIIIYLFNFIHSLYIGQMQWYNIDKYNLVLLVHQGLEGRELYH